jgi:uncharacterized protein (TIGR02001 family)
MRLFALLVLAVTAALVFSPARADGEGPAVAAPTNPNANYQPEPAAAITLAGTEVSVTGHVGLTSDYTFRGVNLSGSAPALSGGVNLSLANGPYIGAWGSTVDLGSADDTYAQVDVMAGYRTDLFGSRVDIGVVQHNFLGQPTGMGLDFYEFRAGAAHDFTVANQAVTVGASAAWSPDFAGPLEDSLYSEVSAATPVYPGVIVSGALGNQHFFNGFDAVDFTNWNAGVSFGVAKNLAFDARYVGTDAPDGFGSRFDDRAVVSLKYAL